MYNVYLLKAVSNKIIELTNEEINGDHLFNGTGGLTAFTTKEVMKELFYRLKVNPFQYPKLSGDIRFVVELYMTFILVYKVVENDVIIFDAIEEKHLRKQNNSNNIT